MFERIGGRDAPPESVVGMSSLLAKLVHLGDEIAIDIVTEGFGVAERIGLGGEIAPARVSAPRGVAHGIGRGDEIADAVVVHRTRQVVAGIEYRGYAGGGIVSCVGG